MKRIKLLQFFLITVLTGALAAVTTSCSNDDDKVTYGYGTVKGTVFDYEDNPLEGVAITVKDMQGNVDATGTTGADGTYTLTNVPMASRTVNFAKEGFQTSAATVTESKFIDGVATIDISMNTAIAVIEGTVYDYRNGNAPMGGVTVSFASESTVTASDGTYIFEYLAVDDYELTFSAADYPTIKRVITSEDFVDNVAVLDAVMGLPEILPERTSYELGRADKWYYNEYRGGRGADNYPHYDWSTDYMASMDFTGKWEEQNEGTTLQITNERGPDTENFNSYVVGSKLITADNYIFSLRMRCHAASTSSSPTVYGIQVVDLSQANPTAVKIGGNRTSYVQSDTDVHIDLSAYIGKEIIIAVGIYRVDDSENKQLVLRAFRFASSNVTGANWLPGTSAIAGWELPLEAVRSTMPQTKKSFSGISPVGGNRDSYWEAYQSWRNVNHVAMEWSFVPLFKDPEVFPGEGYLIKTRGGGSVNTLVPESYFYAKFSIAAGNNKMDFYTRTFGSNSTFFKIVAIDMNGNSTAMQPSHAPAGSAAADGTWSFNHDGGNGGLDGYAKFEYDFSSFNGQDIVIAIAVFNGALNDDENKLVLRQINFY